MTQYVLDLWDLANVQVSSIVGQTLCEQLIVYMNCDNIGEGLLLENDDLTS